jgi:hypothetical protein
MTLLPPDRAKPADDALALLRAWQGEAETQRQLALLRQAGRPA